jgi:hypothetical protein
MEKCRTPARNNLYHITYYTGNSIASYISYSGTGSLINIRGKGHLNSSRDHTFRTFTSFPPFSIRTMKTVTVWERHNWASWLKRWCFYLVFGRCRVPTWAGHWLSWQSFFVVFLSLFRHIRIVLYTKWRPRYSTFFHILYQLRHWERHHINYNTNKEA